MPLAGNFICISVSRSTPCTKSLETTRCASAGVDGHRPDFIGRSVQFWGIGRLDAGRHPVAQCGALKRFVANPGVKVAALFEPFVLAMQRSIIICTV